jgi:hypothetical protein
MLLLQITSSTGGIAEGSWNGVQFRMLRVVNTGVKGRALLTRQWAYFISGDAFIIYVQDVNIRRIDLYREFYHVGLTAAMKGSIGGVKLTWIEK